MSERGRFSDSPEELLDWMEDAELLDLEAQLEAAIAAEMGDTPMLDLPKIIREEPL